MLRALLENERSESFSSGALGSAGYASADDLADRPPERVHRLVAPTASSSRRAEILAGLVPTGVSWNATGYTLAVSYGRHDVPGWSDSKGAICAWNLRRGDVDAREEPDAFIETDNCVQCLRFHPEHPALVAAGTLDGDVFVFSLDESDAARRDGDPLVAKSSARPATLAHREPVTGVHWQFDLAEASKRADATLAYDLVSVAGDGRALVWDWRPDAPGAAGKIASLTFGHEIVAPHPETGRATTWGVASASFPTDAASSRSGGAFLTAASSERSGAVKNAASASFVVGSDGGPVLACSARASKTAAEEFRRKIADHFADASSAPPSLSRTAVVSQHEPHAGAVNGVSVNPRDASVFATGGADGAVRIYARRARRRVASLHPSAGAAFDVQWSPHRPLVLAAGCQGGEVVLYDLFDERARGAGGGEGEGIAGSLGAGRDASRPRARFGGASGGGGGGGGGGERRADGDPGEASHCCVAFNPALPEYLASADAGGVSVWELGRAFARARPGEEEALADVARAGLDEVA